MEEMQSLEIRTCPTMSNLETTVRLPVRVCPFADPGTVVVECSGAHTIESGYNTCTGNINGSCEFTISQTMNIGIPVVFGASVQIGDAYVECGGASGTIDEDCPCDHTVVEFDED